jgi:hypothetical protein
MAQCSVRNCTEEPIGGFLELIEISSFIHPRQTIPAAPRYWCERHQSMELEVRGKLGQRIELAPGNHLS